MSKLSKHYGPYEPMPKRKTKTSIGLKIFLSCLGAIIIALLAWFLTSPNSFARVYGNIFGPELAIDGLEISLERQSILLTENQPLEIHPSQNIAIMGIKSNRWRNYDLTVSSPEFDVTRLGPKGQSFYNLLGRDAFSENRDIQLEIKEADEVKAHFTLRAVLKSLDFTIRANEENDPAQKAALYQKALNLEPSSADLRQKLIDALLAAEDYEKVAELWEEDLQKNPTDQAALRKLLNLYTELELPEKKLGILVKLADLSTGDSQSRIGYLSQMAEIYQEIKQNPEAIGVYEELIKLDKNSEIFYLEALEKIYKQSHQTEREVEIKKRLLPLVSASRAQVILTEIIALYEKNGDLAGQLSTWQSLAENLTNSKDQANAYKKIGFLRAQQNNYPEARTAYQKASELDPEDLSTYLNLARLALNLGDKDNYRQNLLKILAKDPNQEGRRLELAESFYEDKMYAEAKKEYNAILAKDPQNQAAHLKLIHILELEGNQPQLLLEYEKLLKNSPQDKIAAYNFGVLCFKEKQWARAIGSFLKVLEQDPQDQQARRYLLAAYQETGQKKEMLAQALELYRLNPEKKQYLDIMVAGYRVDKNWQGLAQAAQESIRLNPKDVNGFKLLAEAQTNLDQKTEAAQSLLKVAEISSKDKAAWLTAGKKFWQLKDIAQAQKAYQKVMEIDPNNEEAASILIELNILELNKKQSANQADK